MVLQIGMGTDIRGSDYTKAAVRALRDALWHNGLSVADAVGLPVDAMQVEVTIGVPRPDRVDSQKWLSVEVRRVGQFWSCAGTRTAGGCEVSVNTARGVSRGVVMADGRGRRFAQRALCRFRPVLARHVKGATDAATPLT